MLKGGPEIPEFCQGTMKDYPVIPECCSGMPIK